MGKFKFLLLGFIVTGGMFISSERIHAQDYTPKVGDVIKTQTNPTVFLVDDQLKSIPLSREAYVVRYGNDWSIIKVVADSQIGTYDYTGTINALVSHVSGSLVIYTTDHPTIYLLQNGFKRPIATEQAFVAGGYNQRPIEWIGTFEAYPTGPSIN